MNMLDEANRLFESFEAASTKERWSMPFPMGVFGTLRLGGGNDGRMVQPVKYASHHKAFLPHFYAQGLGITSEAGHSGVFEVFTYKPEDWPKMIPAVDSLEGFTPGQRRYEYGYWRTLVWLHILPQDFEHKFYPDVSGEKRLWSYGALWERGAKRTLEIPQEEWSKYPRVPCWVYSSLNENEQARKIDGHTIIWDG